MAEQWSRGDPPREAESELRELEDELGRLSGVLAVRVVGDRVGRPVEVHILSDHSKPPKQTVRDVRAVAQTVFGLELDHRIVSVAQFNPSESSSVLGTELMPAEVRPRVGGVHVDAQGLRAQVRVILVESGNEFTGYAEGSIASVARAKLVAGATLDALRQIEPSADAIHIESADITRVGSSRVAVVTVVYVEPPLELFVSGSAIVRRDRDDAVARALLDATNRRLSRSERGR